MTDLVAEIDIPGTLDPFRGQGYGRTVLAHATGAVISHGLVPFLVIADGNVAALRIARHVGYQTYGRQLLVHEA
jgi:predicted GNAT family acetyltransferase